ncbi:tyrosine/phenylalanine carboxypeptidase domain-containing protein [Aeromicrobium ginsengisoli]|uniref:DUF1704 domain-containing protein n=1 Tax=Aeromicrobium ginsengisoli TaxID=363867 RepID=A0A5M4FIR0_9ACTN|nr:tyrosine/phenylalanine carboxypeptidase domain-containing protein [Aeromicrobium ginsengisoli]KAA1399643.1 DUF1704 domain-containing protein [Aeromicrobium ginsengisoli]
MNRDEQRSMFTDSNSHQAFRETGRHAIADAKSLKDALTRRLGDSMHDAWWRRGGEILERCIQDVRAAQYPMPTNLQAVRCSLLRHGTADGMRWEYDEHSATAPSLGAVEKVIDLVQNSDHPLAEPLEYHIGRVLAGHAILRDVLRGRVGNEHFTDWSKRQWGVPSGPDVEAARALLERTFAHEQDEVLIEGSEVITAFEALLKDVDGQWSVAARSGAALVAVNSDEKTVFVNVAHPFRRSAIRRLMVHEIGGHVTRTNNAARHSGVLTTVPLGNDAMATEEGLALYVERLLGVSSAMQERVYAARAVGVAVALEEGIDVVFAALEPSVGAEAAAQIAVRVKRGVEDFSAPGAFTKDHVYLSGGSKVSAALARQPDLLPTLLSTKWDLDTARKHGDLLRLSDQPPFIPDQSFLADIDCSISTLRTVGE